MLIFQVLDLATQLTLTLHSDPLSAWPLTLTPQTSRDEQPFQAEAEKQKRIFLSEVTFLPGFCDDISGRFAHHLGNIQWTVNLLSNCDSPVHRLRFHLKHTMATHTHNLDTQQYTLDEAGCKQSQTLQLVCVIQVHLQVPPQGETVRVLLVHWFPDWGASSAPEEEEKELSRSDNSSQTIFITNTNWFFRCWTFLVLN